MMKQFSVGTIDFALKFQQKILMAEIEKQKQRLREEAAAKENEEVRSDGSAGDNEA